jgi:hypothetical protein
MKTTPLPAQTRLHELLSYDLQTGKLYWKSRDIREFATERAAKTWNKRFAGKEAFTAVRADGYFGGAINSINYLAHRVIFMMLHGYEPEQIDHDNRDRSDNRPGNLVDSNATHNSRNAKRYSNNTSGHTGITWDKSRQSWITQITVQGENKHLGRFPDINDAIEARRNAEAAYGFHKNHGK